MSGFAAAFHAADVAALALFVALWARIEAMLRPGRDRPPSTGELMAEWRLRWMATAAGRDNRIVDGQLIAALRGGVALMLSSSLIALGGAIALIGRADQVASVAADLAGEATAPRGAWTAKLLLVIAVLAAAFLHFVWSHRQFGHALVMLGAIPNDHRGAEAQAVAARAGRLNVLAARSFNRGLRAVYFALAGLAWLVGPLALALASGATFWVLYRREFLSETRKALLSEPALAAEPPENAP